MTTYIVSAFPDRLPPLLEQLRAQDVEPQIISAPLGKRVRETDPDLWPSIRWRDPFHKRLTTWGELACIAGHREAWSRIAEGEDEWGIVLEDDAYLEGDLPLNPSSCEADLVFLGHKEMATSVAPDQGEHLPLFAGHQVHWSPYSYWTVGYMLTKETANRLLQTLAKDAWRSIALDEFLPYHYGEQPRTTHLIAAPLGLKAWSLDKPLVRPSGRGKSGTETQDYAFDLLTLIPSSDDSKSARTVKAFEDLGHEVHVIGSDHTWSTTGEGGRQKLEWALTWADKIAGGKRGITPFKIVLMCDGYDVLPTGGTGTPQNFLKRFGELLKPAVIGCEASYWPDRGLATAFATIPPQFKEEHIQYPYPCSGALMAHLPILRQEFGEAVEDGDKDDQALIQKRILNNPGDWYLDREAYIFANRNRADQDYRPDGYNTATKTWPLLHHYNGPMQMPGARPVWPDVPSGPVEPQWIEVADGVLAIRLFTPKMAAELDKFLQEQDQWHPLKGDAVPGDELRLRHVDQALHDQMSGLINGVMEPVINARWHPATWNPVNDLFAIRYSRDKQPSLRLHNDIAMFSGSIILRRACGGGVLHLPRQNFTDRDFSAGWSLWWPSQVTHPHKVTPVTKGRRTSLVVWTQK